MSSSANLGTARGRVEIDADGAVRAFTETEQAAAGFMGGLEQHSRALDKTGKAMLGIGVAALGGLGVAVKTTANFEQAMNRVGAVSGATGDKFEALKDLAKDLGRTTAFSASEAAEGMSYLAMAGFDVDEILSAMPGTLQLAAAGQLDLARAADIASNVLTGYGFTAEDIGRVNDVLAYTSANANTDINQLGDAMAYVAPLAAASGVQFEEASAAIGKLSDAGIQGGRAGTTLRQIISALENPTGQAADALERLGVTTHDSAGNMLPLVDIVRQMEDAGLSTADAMQIFGARAGPGMMALVSQGADSLAELTEELENSGGAAGEMADRQLEGLNGQLTMLKSAIEGALIGVGEQLLPYVTRLAEFITNLVQRFANLSPAMQKFIAIGTAVGGVLLVLGGAALMILARIPMMVAGIKALGAALSFLHAGPIGLVILAIAAIAAGLVWLYKNNETFRNFVLAAWEVIRNAIAVVAEWFMGTVVPMLQRAWEVISSAARAVADFFMGTIVPAFQAAWEFIKTAAEAVSNFFSGTVAPAIQATFSAISSAAEWLSNAVTTAWNFIMDIVRPIVEWFNMHVGPVFYSLYELFMEVWNLIVAKFQEAWQAIELVGQLLTALWTVISDAFAQMWEKISAIWSSTGAPMADGIGEKFQVLKDMLAAVFGFIGDAFSALWEKVQAVWEVIGPPIINAIKVGFEIMKDYLQTIWNIVRTIIETALNFIRRIIDAAIHAIRGDWSGAWTLIKMAFQGVWEAIKNIGQMAMDFIQRTIVRILGVIRNIWQVAWNAVRTLFTNAWNGIRQAVTNGANTMLNFVRSIPRRILSALGNLGKLLINAGKALIRGFTQGIRNMISAPIDAVRNGLSRIRNLLPFSPAKEGPFSGKGWTLHSGKSIVEALAKGMEDQERNAVRATEGIARSLHDALALTVDEPALGALASGKVDLSIPRGLREPERRRATDEHPAASGPSQTVTIERIEARDPHEAARAADEELGWEWRSAGLSRVGG
jgi:TP901 family phage tail tape measure protein